MRIKNIVIYIVVCVTILVSFKVPDVLIEIVENNIESKVYEKEKNEKSIDIEAEKIYLVKAIHDIESENTKVEISSSKKSWTLVESPSEGENEKKIESTPKAPERQLLKLKDFNILHFNIDEGENYKASLISKIYKCKDSYTINNIFLSTSNELYNIEMEEKTGKILFINFAKENLYDESTIEEILINYVKYLDLYIIDDWHYENNVLKSDKAGLMVGLVENSTRYILAIHSVEKNSNNVIYVYND